MTLILLNNACTLCICNSFVVFIFHRYLVPVCQICVVQYSFVRVFLTIVTV